MIKLRLVFLAYVLTLLVAVLTFNSPAAAREYSLDDLYRIALERAERIKVSEEDLYITERGKDKALAVLLPRLSVFGDYTRYSDDKTSGSGFIIQPEDSTSWGLKLDQTLSLSGREVTAFKISKENIEKSRYDLYAVREEYLFGVSSAYYDVLKAQKAVEIARANMERLTGHRDAADIRLKVGEVTKTALLRAEAELSGAQSELVKAENGLKLAKAVLARQVGISEDYELKESGVKVETFKDRSLVSLKEEAMIERSEVRSLDIQRKTAEDQVRYVRGTYWPTVSIEGVYSRKEDSPAPTFVLEETTYGGIRLNFPFFEGGLRRAEVKEAEARQRQSELIYEDLKKTINIEVENAYLDLITQREILKSLEDQLAFAGDNYNATSKQFEFGLANSIDVMDANTLLVTSERQLAEARLNYRLADLRLKRATGTLLKTVVDSQQSAVSGQ
ncbi:MAG: TolC family protein [Thermodesulfobacteriota bacterium]|nr:TolC family protein [Thermodesulfobacteriota bacterium]